MQEPFDANDDYSSEIDIVANTYRAIVDQHAFEAMIASWDAKLNAIDDRKAPPEFSTTLLAQLAMAKETLENLDIPAENDPLSRAVREVPGPAVVLAPDKRVVVTNAAGAVAFRVRQGAYFKAEVVSERSLSDFNALCRAANRKGNLGQAILQIEPSGHSTGDTQKPFLAEAFTVQVPGQDKAHIAIRTLEFEMTPVAVDKLKQAFELSDAEAEVARLFFQYRDLKEIADRRRTSLLTVRTQVKSLLVKTESATQADLIRLLAMIASREAMSQRGEISRWRDPLGREKRLKLEDGRSIAWTWMGASDGKPAILMRGLTIGYLLPQKAQEQLKAAGIKLYALSRPGYGNSSLHADMDVLQDNLAALRAFLDHEIPEPCVGIGMSEGIIPLLAEQNDRPERFSKLISIGFTGVLNRHCQERLPLIQKTMLRLTPKAPWMVEMLAKLGHRMMQRYGVDWYLERAYRDCALDMACCADPNLVSLLRDAGVHLLTQGHQTFVRDLQLYLADVDHTIDTLNIEMLCLIPTEDGIYRASEYAALEARNPLIHVEAVPKSAAFLIYQQTDLVVEHIIRAVHGS